MNTFTTVTRYRGIGWIALLAGLAMLLWSPSTYAQGSGGRLAAAPGVIYFMPDTIVDPHMRDFHMPVYLANPLSQPVCDPSTLRLSISYNGTLFFARSVTRGTITGRTVNGNIVTVDIDMNGSSAVQQGVVTELVGDMMVGSEQSTDFNLAVTCGGAPVTDSVRRGSIFDIPGFCEQGSDRLLLYTNGLRINKIAPNPASGQVTVNVTTIEEEDTFLEIFGTDGARVYSTMWRPVGTRLVDMARTITLPRELPNGLYRVVLRSPLRSDAQTLVIIH